MTNCVILVSGSGAIAQALIASAYFGEIPDMTLTLVASSSESYAITRARNAGVATYVVDRAVFPNEATFQKALLHKLDDLDADLVVLAGFTPDLGEDVTEKYCGRIMSVVPELQSVFSAAAGAVGSCVYFLDERGRTGRLIAEKRVEVAENDTAETLTERLVDAACEILPPAVKDFCAGLFSDM